MLQTRSNIDPALFQPTSCRADFRGEEIDSFIDGSKVRHFPSRTRNAYVLQSVASIVSLILLVVGVVVSIYVIRYSIVGDVSHATLAVTR